MIKINKDKPVGSAKPDVKIKPDLDALERAGIAGAGRWPSELSPTDPDSAEITKSVPGAVLKGKRVRVKAAETKLFLGNPRLSEPGLNFDPETMQVNVDISDLEPLIKESQGNAQAVDGRLVNGSIEIIAGLRRRQACMNPKYWLTVDLYYDVTDEQAVYIAETENEGRKERTFIGRCVYLAQRFVTLKETNFSLTVGSFADMYSCKQRMMQYYLRIGELPAWLIGSVKNNKSWTARQAIDIQSKYSELITKHGEQRIKELVAPRFPSAKGLLTALESLEQKPDDKPVTNEVPGKDGQVYTVRSDKTGKVVVKTSAPLTDDQFVKLQAFLAAL